MYVCLSSYKVPVILAILMKLEFPRPILKKCQISNFMKILSVGAAFFSADGRTDGQHDKADGRVSQFCQRA